MQSEFTFHYDSMSAGMTGFEHWTLNSIGVPSEIVGCLADVLMTLSDVTHCHVKGHTGHPWNTVVDGMAKHVVKSNDVLTDFLINKKRGSYNYPCRRWAIGENMPRLWACLLFDDELVSQLPQFDRANQTFYFKVRNRRKEGKRF